MTTEFEIKNCKDSLDTLKGLIEDSEKGLTCNSKEHYEKHFNIVKNEYIKYQDEYPEFFI